MTAPTKAPPANRPRRQSESESKGEPLRLVIDANVFVAAVLSPRGPPGRLLRLLAETPPPYRLFLSQEMIAEISEVLDRPKIRRRLPSGFDAQQWLVEMAALSDVIDVPDSPRVCDDPDDDKNLGTALHGMAEYLVTGDDDLLRLRTHEGISIITPAQCLQVLQGHQGE